MSTHAKLSPSGASQWMNCPGSVALQLGLPDSRSEYADEGTAAHFLAEQCLTNKVDAMHYHGHVIRVTPKGETYFKQGLTLETDNTFNVDEEMCEAVQTYVDAIRDYSSGEGDLAFFENRVNFSDVIGVPDSFGTSDAIIITGDYKEIQVHDLKYGRGVRVDAMKVIADGVSIPNKQMALYALGALEEHGLCGDFERVRLVIHQPRLGHISECVFRLSDLQAFAVVARQSAQIAIVEADAYEIDGDASKLTLNAGADQCQWCKVKATCPALNKHVMDTVIGDFDDVSGDERPASVAEAITQAIAEVPFLEPDDLAVKRDALDLIEMWSKAVAAKVSADLHQGLAVGHYKLVAGRKGARAWHDPDEAEKLMKSMRLKQDQMYTFKVISPTAAEKLKKEGGIGARQWPKLESMIVQKEGQPVVVDGADKRPAIVIAAVADDFADESGDLT